MALPTSDLPGHQLLHERASAALDRLQEFPAVDFKESADWETLRWRIVKTILGMGNLRDGGLVVVGVSERGTTRDPIGIDPDHLATYDVDEMEDAVQRYVSPRASFDVVLHTHSNGETFLVIHVHEFEESPQVCRRDGGSLGQRPVVVAGAVYVRPLEGRARTTKVTRAEEMHDLLELAAEKRARRILEVGRRVGMIPSGQPTDPDGFEAELGGL